MKLIEINGLELEVSEELAKIYNHFKKYVPTNYIYEEGSEHFLKLFSYIYLKDSQGFYQDEKLARSNWTQLTANSFFKTCQLMRLKADFEVEKRHDGALRNEKGEVFICAEWEYDTNSIFKPKGEIEKLYETCKKYKVCDAFLFSYKLGENYIEYAEKIFLQWKNYHQKDEDFKLYVLTAVFEKDDYENIRYLKSLRLIGLTKNNVEIWDDFE